MATLEMMSIEERCKYLRLMQPRYRQADRETKKRLLDEMEAFTGLHRKSLIRCLKGRLTQKSRARERTVSYGPEADAALGVIWEALDHACAERLQPSLVSTGELLAQHGELYWSPSLARDWGRSAFQPCSGICRQRRSPTAAARGGLPRTGISGRFPRTASRATSLIRGHLEMDLVHHCGETTEGEYVYTGRRCGHRVARLMRLQGVSRRPRHPKTTQAAADRAVPPDLLQRDFTAGQPNTRWTADVTYVATRQGWLYLAVVMDLYSRMIVGWAMEPHMEASLVCQALEMGLQRRRPPAGLIHHSDRGSQYTSNQFQELLAAHQVRPSVGRTGNCYDNAVTESFFSSLKAERIQGAVYLNRDAARMDLFQYIEVFYNRQRLHSTLGYRSPVTFEQEHHPVLTAH